MNTPICAISVLDNYGYIIFKENLIKKCVDIYINVKNISEGLHGFHIHTYGDLRDNCKHVCDHYNPKNKNHGGPNSKDRHVGDLGNIKVNSKGICKTKMSDKVIKLRGKYSIIGRSVVIHEDEDDLGLGNHSDSLKTGHAGKKITCGVIGYCKNTKC
jgi:Cu-Zn family superoxide dismutase